ncbi:archaetidylinositol phosphate synthase [Palaeococcus ferrophilus]|uniref:archaetidylinositol phosphate synthase n=1 Tax=Palaeococcus ferrophilus TaxID=83868 RepID=UPI00064E67B9|nr:archaetidylinositol phosphate synthase [Palaeococcus ferrophilus]
MLNKYRSNVKGILEAIVRPLARAGVTPNTVTVLGLAISLLGAYLFYRGEQFWAAIVLLVGSLIDALDGTLARMTEKTSAFGAFLDSTFDRVSDGAVLFGIALGNLVDWRWAFLTFMGAYLVSYERCRAELAGAGSLAVGIAERAERLLILILGALFGRVEVAVYVVGVLAWITAFQRMWVARERLNR